MPPKKAHKPDRDKHNEKESREFLRRRRDEGGAPLDDSLQHRSGESVVEGGDNEQKGEPTRPGHITPMGPRPLKND